MLTGFLAYLVMGAIQAMYGPAFPGLLDRFAIGVGRVGDVVALHFAGSFVTIAASGLFLTRLGYRPVMRTGGAVMTTGALAVALAPTWPWVLVGAVLGGVGFGLLNITFNLMVVRVFAPHAAPFLNLQNALFGVGAVLGPVAVGLAGATLRVPFLLLAMITLIVTVAVTWLPEPERPGGGAGERIPWLPAFGFMAMYFLYVSAEVGVASWETVHLEPFLGARDAAFATSAYWAALTVGRLLASPLSAYLRPSTLVLGSACLGFAGLGLAHVVAIAPVAYAVVGLTFAPIFPTGLAWLQRVFPRRAEQVAPLVVASANLGPVATASVIGAAVSAFGSEVIPSLLAVLAGALVAVTLALWRGTGRRPARSYSGRPPARASVSGGHEEGS